MLLPSLPIGLYLLKFFLNNLPISARQTIISLNYLKLFKKSNSFMDQRVFL